LPSWKAEAEVDSELTTHKRRPADNQLTPQQVWRTDFAAQLGNGRKMLL
jgi:hypothetical protein